jgi:cytochrome b
MTGQHAPAEPTIRVWDALVRLGHWALVIAVVLAWLTRHGGGARHEYLGYLSLGVVALRVLWGWRGSRHARFADFLQGPGRTLEYARQMLRGQEPRYLGHNPLGGWMTVALLCTVALVGASGWLYTTDRFWGVAWVESVHRRATNVLLGLAALHVAGVLYASARHRENLIGAMFHGRRRSIGRTRAD